MMSTFPRVLPALPLLGLFLIGCSVTPAAVHVRVEPSFALERDGLHPEDAARLAAEAAARPARPAGTLARTFPAPAAGTLR